MLGNAYTRMVSVSVSGYHELPTASSVIICGLFCDENMHAKIFLYEATVCTSADDATSILSACAIQKYLRAQLPVLPLTCTSD